MGILLCVLTGLLAAGAIAMWIRVERRMQGVEADVSHTKEKLDSDTGALAKSVAELSRNLEAAAVPIEEPQAVAVSGVTATSRAKILKMHRLGRSPEQIATVLKLQKAEVTLLLKVHRIVMQGGASGFACQPAEKC